MTTEMNPSPVTVTNPAETPGTPDVSPTGPVTPAPTVAETTNDAGSCATSATPGAKTDSGSCDSTRKSGAPDVAATSPSTPMPEKSPDSGCCASSEKDGKSAVPGSN